LSVTATLAFRRRSPRLARRHPSFRPSRPTPSSPVSSRPGLYVRRAGLRQVSVRTEEPVISFIDSTALIRAHLRVAPCCRWGTVVLPVVVPIVGGSSCIHHRLYPSPSRAIVCSLIRPPPPSKISLASAHKDGTYQQVRSLMAMTTATAWAQAGVIVPPSTNQQNEITKTSHILFDLLLLINAVWLLRKVPVTACHQKGRKKKDDDWIHGLHCCIGSRCTHRL